MLGAGGDVVDAGFAEVAVDKAVEGAARNADGSAGDGGEIGRRAGFGDAGGGVGVGVE
nr:hypothetical protein [Polymorphobacter glacialis]